jgi:predicted nucleotide-binding protein
MAKRHLFISYARQDREIVMPIVGAVREEYHRRAIDLDVWVDMDNLIPGQNWAVEITKTLRDSIGLLIFISPAAMKSDWVNREILAVMEHPDRFVIPVILRHVQDLPPSLSRRQWLDLSKYRKERDLIGVAQEIADATVEHLRTVETSPPVSSAEAPIIAATMAQEARAEMQVDVFGGSPPDSVFLVHGHDSATISIVEAYLTGLGVKTFVLSRVGSGAQSLLQKFFKSAADARFAIVILSPDDLGASRIQYEADGIGDRALQFRARQNVILELGYFYGYLGWERVFVLYRPPEKVHPNFERPSDIDGVVFDSMDVSGSWRESLALKLLEAGFNLIGQ